MFDPADVRGAVAQEIRSRSWRYTILGIVSLILGSLGIVYAGVVTVTSILAFGAFLVVGGAVQLYQALSWRDSLAVAVQVPIAILELVVGGVMLSHPVASIIGLTLLLAAFFVVAGTYRAIFAAAVRYPSWGWQVLSGLVSVFLGVLVWWEWPVSSLWLLGTFVAVYLLVGGWAYLMLGLVARSLAEGDYGRPAPRPAT
jgi:uncharacterized membrane protein HdeD (DUF308 family)